MIKRKKILISLSIILCCLGAIVFLINKLSKNDEPLTKLNNLNLLKEGKQIVRIDDKKYYSDCFKITEIPQVDADMGAAVDFLNCDVTELDLIQHAKILNYVAFNTNTMWGNLPEWFSPNEIMEWGKNPGLGITNLHHRGITGKGVNVAVIDSALLLDHVEYADNIVTYEFLNYYDEMTPMHGTAVLSKLAGENLGVAPGADIYYIACTFGSIIDGESKLDLSYMAEAICRILELNEYLPYDDKIRVISISRGFTQDEKGYEKVISAIEEAKKKNVFVITVSTEQNYGFKLEGLGREYYSDPDDIRSYNSTILGNRRNLLIDTEYMDSTVCVPMDATTFACFTGREDYAFSRITGYSFAVPWLAGMYALCVQVYPDITPDLFIELITECTQDYEYWYMSKKYLFSGIIAPEEIIERLLIMVN